MSDTITLISTGEELLTGETIDTNSAWLAAEVWDRGFSVSRMFTCGDALEELVWTFSEASRTSDKVICTGGLGPTVDDRTAIALAEWAGVPCEESPEALAQITERYARRGRTVSQANRKQAWLPQGAVVLENKWGSAPAFALTHEGTTVVCLPGVPLEMRKIFEASVAPMWTAAAPTIVHKVRSFGVAESRLQATLSELDLGEAELGFRAHIPEVQVKLRFDGGSHEHDRTAVVERVKTALGDAVYSVDGGDLAETVVQRLLMRQETVALAESCTAGLVTGWLGDVSGVSAVLLESVVTYANEAKVRLGVPETDIAENGAVSEPVAMAMASAIRERAQSTWGVSITGIAGPSGGTPNKPVGTVHIAVCGPNGHAHQVAVIPGSRKQVRMRAAGGALALLLRQLA